MMPFALVVFVFGCLAQVHLNHGHVLRSEPLKTGPTAFVPAGATVGQPDHPHPHAPLSETPDPKEDGPSEPKEDEPSEPKDGEPSEPKEDEKEGNQDTKDGEGNSETEVHGVNLSSGTRVYDNEYHGVPCEALDNYILQKLDELTEEYKVIHGKPYGEEEEKDNEEEKEDGREEEKDEEKEKEEDSEKNPGEEKEKEESDGSEGGKGDGSEGGQGEGGETERQKGGEESGVEEEKKEPEGVTGIQEGSHEEPTQPEESEGSETDSESTTAGDIITKCVAPIDLRLYNMAQETIAELEKALRNNKEKETEDGEGEQGHEGHEHKDDGDNDREGQADDRQQPKIDIVGALADETGAPSPGQPPSPPAPAGVSKTSQLGWSTSDPQP